MEIEGNLSIVFHCLLKNHGEVAEILADELMHLHSRLNGITNSDNELFRNAELRKLVELTNVNNYHWGKELTEGQDKTDDRARRLKIAFLEWLCDGSKHG